MNELSRCRKRQTDLAAELAETERRIVDLSQRYALCLSLSFRSYALCVACDRSAAPFRCCLPWLLLLVAFFDCALCGVRGATRESAHLTAFDTRLRLMSADVCVNARRNLSHLDAHGRLQEAEAMVQ